MPITKTPAKRKPSTRASSAKKSSFSLATWGIPTVTLFVGISLGSCSQTVSNAGHELSKLTREVLASDQLKEKLGEVLNTTLPGSAVGQEVVAPPEKRTGAEPFKECRQFFAGGQSPILAEQPLQRKRPAKSY